eukprot:GHVQ01013602.1.p1 GENE.GHVQ01013602.1~~GHVQ01013602.1.p1  ORF type:complete len:289 (+),score=15.16 GHVQ01013602.1:730-1596(+)
MLPAILQRRMVRHSIHELRCISLGCVVGTYETFQGSPASEGRLQMDLWNEEYESSGSLKRVKCSGRWDWIALKNRIRVTGLRNSLLVALMPTATTSQILGNNEAFEPYTSNVYSRRVLSGEYYVVNAHLVRDLVAENMWSEDMKDLLIEHNGSIQNIPSISTDLKLLYRTVWELPQKEIVDMAVDRAPFVDQSQSLNIHMTSPSYAKMSSLHFYGWKRGLKTGLYYLRTLPPALTPCLNPRDVVSLPRRKLDVSPLKGFENAGPTDSGGNKMSARRGSFEGHCTRCSS